MFYLACVELNLDSHLLLICNFLGNEAARSFDSIPKQKYIALAGFFFLRFIVPGIMSVEGVSKRRLMLISKALQNLANGIYFKEAYMANALNSWIDDNRPKLESFFDRLTTLQETLHPELVETLEGGNVPSSQETIFEFLSVLSEIKKAMLTNLHSFDFPAHVFVKSIKLPTAEYLFSILLSLGVPVTGRKISFLPDSPSLLAFLQLLTSHQSVQQVVVQEIASTTQTQPQLQERLAKCLVTVSIAHGSGLELLKVALLHHVQQSSFKGFLSNTLLRNLVGFYFTRIGAQWIEPLAQLIEHVRLQQIDIDLFCSNALKRVANIAQLLSVGQKFLNLTISLLKKCPGELWDLCSFLKSGKEFEHRQQDVCEFLFITLFCPVVENPSLYGLVSDELGFAQSRTLSHISDFLRKAATDRTFKADPDFDGLNQALKREAAILFAFVEMKWSKPPGQFNSTSAVTITWSEDEEAVAELHSFMYKIAYCFTQQLKNEQMVVRIKYTMTEFIDAIIR